jgi:hypothetical protein
MKVGNGKGLSNSIIEEKAERMIRKTIPAAVVVLTLLSVCTVGWAQEVWRFNEFTASYERFLHEAVSWDEVFDWDLLEDVIQETVFYEQWELAAGDEEMEVTMGYRYWLPLDYVKQDMTFLGAAWDSPSIWKEAEGMEEYKSLSLVAEDLELEVGNTMQLLDGSRLSIVGEETVAGLKGYLVRMFIRETDEDGNTVETVTSEWVIAPEIAWPLAVTLYEDGEVSYRKTLVEYERR